MNKKPSRLSLLEHFECIADRCPDNCCHGWSIPVDSEIHQRWQALEECEVKQAIQASITAEEPGATTEYKLVQGANGDCTHLSPDGLCYVQKRLGHDYLPYTCRAYPRVQVGSDLMQMDSAYLSCPEIARLLVTEKNPKTLFPDTAVTVSNNDVLSQVISVLEKITGKLLAMPTVSSGMVLYYLGSRVIELMQERQRGAAFSALLMRTSKLTRKALSKQLKDLSRAQYAGKLQSGDSAGVRFWSFVVGLTDSDKLQELQALITRHKLEGLYAGQSEAAQASACQTIKSFVKSQNSQSGLRQWRGTLRAYLVVKLRNHGFPYAPVQGNFLVNLLDCSVSLAGIQLWMWLLQKEQKMLTEEDIASIIYKVERAFVHNDDFYQQLNKNPQLLDMSEYLGCLADLG